MKKKQTPKEIKQKKSKPETLEERVHRHLNDISSEITDDDIKNVRTGLEIRSETNPDVEQKEKNNQASENNENEAGGKNKNKQTTLWNNLSEGYEDEM